METVGSLVTALILESEGNLNRQLLVKTPDGVTYKVGTLYLGGLTDIVWINIEKEDEA